MDRNPDHAVNIRERIRDKAFNQYARRGEFTRHWQLANVSFEPWREGEWVDVTDD